ncbi:MAG TPA: DUF4159 domain-containing protein [Bryobacteraceae bacterium]|nr:DUF4159 domain-containing protein [Bryobacteraceae bacterium]
MRLRIVLFAAFSSLALFAAVSETLPPPDQELLPNDPGNVGKRTTRKQQQPGTFRQYYGVEYSDYPVPDDYDVPGEWTFARFMYRAVQTWRGGRWPNWTIDYPRSDRHLSAAVRRLTRIQARSVEEPVAAEDGDDIYNWPWLYAVEVGHWDLTDLQAAKLRDFLNRGGFFMCDDFHGTVEWETFVASMKKVLPDRPIVDLPNSDPIFHTVYDLDDRYQVPGEQFVYSHRTYEKDGFQARWRGIYDDKGRLMVAICHNMDLGDSWEHADNPVYPEQYSALGFRIGIDYLVYAMTH